MRTNDFFEEIAKYRAARRIWHKAMVERYKSQKPALVGTALFHTQDRRLLIDRAATVQQCGAHSDPGSGGSARRHAIAVTPILSMKPGRCLLEFAATIALRTQQIIAHENGRGQHGRRAGRLVLCRKP